MEILIGVLAGIVTALGMGGGTVLILLLTWFFRMEQPIAQASNLVFFIPTALVSVLMHIKNKRIKWKDTIIITIAGVIGAAVGAIVAKKIDVQLLRRLFGIFLLLIAVNEIYSYYKMNRKEKKNAY